MKLSNENDKEKIIKRLRRIEGQVRGIQNMVGEERDCREILQQISAIRSAVQGVGTMLLEDYMSDCFVNLDGKNPDERQELLKDMLQMLGRSS